MWAQTHPSICVCVCVLEFQFLTIKEYTRMCIVSTRVAADMRYKDQLKHIAWQQTVQHTNAIFVCCTMHASKLCVWSLYAMHKYYLNCEAFTAG